MPVEVVTAPTGEKVKERREMLPHLQFTPPEEISGRIARLQEKLAAQDVEGALLIRDVNLYYFAGTIQRSYLYIPAAGRPLLMAQKSYGRACLETPMAGIVQVKSPKEVPQVMADHGFAPGVLALELEEIPAALFFSYQKLFPRARIVDASQAIKQVRMLKSPYELQCIRETAQVIAAMVSAARTVLRPGMTELEASAALYEVARVRGEQGRVRMAGLNRYVVPIHVLAGPSGGVPSFFEGLTGGEGPNPAIAAGSGFRRMQAGEPVYIDFAVAAAGGYIADVTRTFGLGAIDPDLEQAYYLAEEIEAELAAVARPGMPASELYRLSVERARRTGLEDYYLGYLEEQVKFVGHGIGLELDELPALAHGNQMELEPGMVIALEPTFVFPGRGAVGIEDSYVVTDRGTELLTPIEKGLLRCL
ncbi:MAG: aminopeptidase P family protein [Clostridia bacterium]|nr:MAG: aminopeptidase P family protein [Clostridia bacterium]